MASKKKKIRKRNKRMPSTLKTGDIVLLTQARVGVVRYIGSVQGQSQSVNDHYVGIEIRITDGIMGDNDGSFNGKTYFKCAKDCGIFIEPHRIIQVYTPENLLEMIISLKDKLLPLMPGAKTPNTTTSPHAAKKHSDPPRKTWANSPTMQLIKETDEDFPIHNSPAKINILVESPHLNAMKGSLGSPTNILKHKIHQMKQSTQSVFDSVDMKIVAPNNLLAYFERTDGDKEAQLSAFYQGTTSPMYSPSHSPSATGKKRHKHRPSRLSLFRVHSAQQSSFNGSMVSSYQKLKLLHRCVTLRRKTNIVGKPSIVLDLAHFGLYLKAQNINDKHVWYESIWNKYDKLFKLKIDFYFVNELLSDLLNEYLQTEYELSTDSIMTVDRKKAVQQIIIQIRPYHIEQHQNPFDISTLNEDDEDEMPFTFGDCCLLGEWLADIEEMEEDDEFYSDYFMMDMHYFDFVQYINSHKGHIWKKVVHKAIKSKKKKRDLEKFNVNKMKIVVRQMLVDYGKNGLGNVNMEIYHTQIEEYTTHLTKLFNEYLQRNNMRDAKQSKSIIHKKQFFEFVACIPSL